MPADLSSLYLTNYRHPGTQPFGNIMLLSREEAFRVAAELAAAHPDTTAFYRFADFENYYPRRKASEEALRGRFIQLGGRPELPHPYSFVLMENDYLRGWFGHGPGQRILLSSLPDDQISLTRGDSVSSFGRDGQHQVLTKQTLLDEIAAFDGTLEQYLAHVESTWHYIEAQVWSETALRNAVAV
ncbi:MAG: hypothetical protein E7319_04890 [Clostridiales bacterium]|nr:hypothetical protein [Clostridiales bacterium]